MVGVQYVVRIFSSETRQHLPLSRHSAGGRDAMNRTLVATLMCLCAATPAQAQTTSWFDVSLDEHGSVAELIAVGDIHPALADPIRDWVKSKSFAAARVEDRPAPSTTSVWVSYALAPVDGDYELQFLDYGSGPRTLKRSEPDYPRVPLLAGEEGWVRLSFRVQPSGEVGDVKVLESSQRAFEKPALRAMQKWRFRPETIEGKAVSTPMEQTIEFTLE
jgi:TonB family protein